MLDTKRLLQNKLYFPGKHIKKNGAHVGLWDGFREMDLNKPS